MADAYDLQRFVDAQKPLYERVISELRAGSKQSHWMWFIFPQIAGLGRSPTAVRFAVASLDEARAYLAHPILGPRLRECAKLTLDVEGKSAREIFGPVDEMKFRSSMTLFARAAPDEPLFAAVSREVFRRRARPGHARDPLDLSQLGADAQAGTNDSTGAAVAGPACHASPLLGDPTTSWRLRQRQFSASRPQFWYDFRPMPRTRCP